MLGAGSWRNHGKSIRNQQIRDIFPLVVTHVSINTTRALSVQRGGSGCRDTPVQICKINFAKVVGGSKRSED